MINVQKILWVAVHTEAIHSGIPYWMKWMKFAGFRTVHGEIHDSILQIVKEWIYLGIDQTKATSGSCWSSSKNARTNLS